MQWKHLTNVVMISYHIFPIWLAVTLCCNREIRNVVDEDMFTLMCANSSVLFVSMRAQLTNDAAWISQVNVNLFLTLYSRHTNIFKIQSTDGDIFKIRKEEPSSWNNNSLHYVMTLLLVSLLLWVRVSGCTYINTVWNWYHYAYSYMLGLSPEFLCIALCSLPIFSCGKGAFHLLFYPSCCSGNQSWQNLCSMVLLTVGKNGMHFQVAEN